MSATKLQSRTMPDAYLDNHMEPFNYTRITAYTKPVGEISKRPNIKYHGKANDIQ